MAKGPTKLSFVPLSDVERLVDKNQYEKTEEQLIAGYNSSITIPQLIFLGIDERNKEGVQWKRYTGAPYFALDVTPKGSTANEAEGVIAEMERRGLKFLEGRTHMSLPAPEGKPCD